MTKTFTSRRDNTLFEYAGVDLSNGAGPVFFAGRTKQPQGSVRRGLIFFDLAGSGIPPYVPRSRCNFTYRIPTSARKT